MRTQMTTGADSLPGWDKITLTQEEFDDAIYQRKLEKYYLLQEQEQRNFELTEREKMRKPFTPDELSKFILSQNPWFKVDEQAKPIYTMLCAYFSGSKSFEQMGQGFSLDKGICLAGVPGCGKTAMMELFQKNKRQSFIVVSMVDVHRFCLERGAEFYELYTGQVPGHNYSKEYFLNPMVGWCFDEVGAEEVLNDHGNKVNIFSSIFQKRYNNRSVLPPNLGHMTTMLTPLQLKERYGNYVIGRMNEMINFISYEGADRRFQQ